jgi:hypothetical protein
MIIAACGLAFARRHANAKPNTVMQETTIMTKYTIAMFLLAVLAGQVSAQGDAASRKAQSKAFAERIDKIISKGLDQERIKPGPKAELAQLTRRLHIDLTGRIPTVVQLADLIDPSNDAPTKVEDRIDALLADDAYAENFARYWRSVMLSGPQARQQTGFEAWLRTRLSVNTPYDKIARELMVNQPVKGPTPSPAAFFNLNGNKAENLAGATARVFLGVKIECAECHQHPFAKWSRKQFWEFAAFFSTGAAAGKQIKMPLSDDVIQAKFLTGEEPKWAEGAAPRQTLADWTIARENPFFAKAAVDHVWQYFFGVGLVAPILEPTDASPRAHPELLEELAKGFIDNDYDLKFLIRSIVLTDAYRRSSVALSEASKVEIETFARVPVRGMMPEQLFDSLIVATEARGRDVGNVPQVPKGGAPMAQRRAEFMSMYTSPDKAIETQTSILQALYLMNGAFVTERSKRVLQTIAVQNTSTERRVEALYMMVLSRLPREPEMQRMVRYIDSGGGSGDPQQAVVDVCWALLNSSEFMLNH